MAPEQSADNGITKSFILPGTGGSAYNSPGNRRYREILEQHNGDYLRVRNQQDEAKKLGSEILKKLEKENLSFAKEGGGAAVNKILKALYDRNKPKPLRVQGLPIPLSEILDKDYLGGVLDNNKPLSDDDRSKRNSREANVTFREAILAKKDAYGKANPGKKKEILANLTQSFKGRILVECEGSWYEASCEEARQIVLRKLVRKQRAKKRLTSSPQPKANRTRATGGVRSRTIQSVGRGAGSYAVTPRPSSSKNERERSPLPVVSHAPSLSPEANERSPSRALCLFQSLSQTAHERPHSQSAEAEDNFEHFFDDNECIGGDTDDDSSVDPSDIFDELFEEAFISRRTLEETDEDFFDLNRMLEDTDENFFDSNPSAICNHPKEEAFINSVLKQL